MSGYYKDERRYDDIISLPHHQSSERAHMSLHDRAAQFAPFAALTGYEDQLKETRRRTGQRIELDEGEKRQLDEKLQYVMRNDRIRENVAFTYFVPDPYKEGGEYVTKKGKIKKLDSYHKKIILEDFTEIPVEEIIEISCENE